MNTEELLRDGAFGIGQAMQFSGLGRSLIYGLMARGDLAYTKVGARRLIPRRALVALLSREVHGRDIPSEPPMVGGRSTGGSKR
jgi:hypothetical protein